MPFSSTTTILPRPWIAYHLDRVRPDPPDYGLAMTDGISVLDLPRPDKRLDDSAITWRQFGGYEGLYYWVLGVDPDRQRVDLFFRLAPGARCPGHRHVGATDTLVIEGEQRTWEKRDGNWVLDQIRPPGFYSSIPGDHLHSEQGGDEGAIVLLSMSAVDGVIWETYDFDGVEFQSVSTIDDFARVLEKQGRVGVRSQEPTS